jgi:hypothetical protein
MKVLCKDNNNLIEGTIKLLTIDKIYKVLKIEQDSEIKLYHIEDDSGEKRWFDSKRFIDATSYIRNNKLNKLLNLSDLKLTKCCTNIATSSFSEEWDKEDDDFWNTY